LTITNLPPELAEALEREKRRVGTSLNQTVIDLLDEALGSRSTRSSGLSCLAGDWSEEEFGEFAAATAQFEETDEEIWS
jgi:hypothetical protein